MTPEDFRNIAAGVQAILVGGAVVFGGIWALYRFFSLREISRARNELEAKERELKHTAILNIGLKTSVTDDIEDLGQFILIDVTADNPGNHPEVIISENSGLSVFPVVRDSNGDLSFDDPVDNILGDTALISASIEPKVTEKFSFSVSVKPGLYRVVFQCSVHSSLGEVENTHAKAGVPIGDLIWRAEKFVEVPTKNLTKSSSGPSSA